MKGGPSLPPKHSLIRIIVPNHKHLYDYHLAFVGRFRAYRLCSHALSSLALTKIYALFRAAITITSQVMKLWLRMVNRILQAKTRYFYSYSCTFLRSFSNANNDVKLQSLCRVLRGMQTSLPIPLKDRQKYPTSTFWSSGT